MSEFALYNIERELRTFAEQNSLQVELVGLIGNGHHKQRMREILLAYRVQTVYHAAAYKHVPIVEQNVIEGIYNNVIATWYAAEAAHETEVETFVLVSTDKAVNPTNVMGATKRFAEMVLQGLHHRGTKTRFCMVTIRQRVGLLGLGGAAVQRANQGGRPGDGDPSRGHPLFHDHSGGGAARDSGRLHGGWRRCVRTRHGQARAHLRSRPAHDSSDGADRARRSASGRRHRDCLHGTAAGGEALRGVADRQ